MSPISKEDYLKLLEEIADEEQDDVPDVSDDSWIWSEAPIKEKIRFSNLHGIVDVTKYRKDKIQDALYKCMNIKVGDFIVKIDTYHGYPDKLGKDVGLTMDIEVWEKRYKTPSGNPCNMDFRIDWSKDNRFFGRPWLKYFSGGSSSSASHVPVDTVIEIIRWMQAIKKMGAFL